MGSIARTKRPVYTDDFRASAVIMLESQGYPQVKGALAAVAKHLGVPGRTLSRWFNREQNAPPDQLVSEKRGEIVERIPGILHQLIDEIEQAMKDAPLSQLSTTFGILVDKQQLLTGKPTERTENTHDVTGTVELRETIQRQLARIATVTHEDGVHREPVH